MTRKNTLRKAFFGILFFALLFTNACKKKTVEPDARTVQLEKLTSTWKVKNVENDGTDVTSQYTGFTLIIDQLTYSTQQGGNPWPASGTYDFKGDDLTKLVRSDNVEVSIDEITDKTLVLTFNYSTVNGGRVNGITGDFTFSLTK